MSNLDTHPTETACAGRPVAGPTLELLEGRAVPLGGPRGMTVVRTLPNRDRRMIGAWCFVDYYGPDDIGGAAGMQVAPHPHTGLQTVSWLVAGEVLHRDSLGHEQLIRPGQLNLMTAGRGISHSEESPADHSPVLHGVQLWTALPDADRDRPPAFAHHPDLPTRSEPGAVVTVIMGRLAGTTSPATVHSPLIGAEVTLAAGARIELPLETSWEHGVLVLAGEAEVDGVGLAAGPLLYLGTERTSLVLTSHDGVRLLLLGGEPFAERIVMWWNFIGRDHEDIATARAEWSAADPRFGEVRGYAGGPLPAPELPTTRLRPRGRLPETS